MPARARFCALLFLLCLLPAAALAQGKEKPKVRALTAFVRLDAAHYRDQVADALVMLRRAKSDFERAGYEVQTIRISTQPFPEYLRGMSREPARTFLLDYDQLAQKEGFDADIGPAMLADADDPQMADLLAEVLAQSKVLNASLVVAGDDGIHWHAVRAAARVMKYLEEHTPHGQGNFNFAASAMVPSETPFYPASYHTGAGHSFAIGLQSANVVAEAFSTTHDPEVAGKALTKELGAHAQAIEAVARRIAQETGWRYVGLDLSPAPLKDVSIGGAIENLTGAPFGSSGTMTAVSVITGVLHALPVQRAGYSGLMLPILEDSVLAQRWSEGRLSLDSMLAYSAVCGTGLDTIPLPGAVSEDQLARILGDMAALAVKWHKPLSARLMPVPGGRPGDRTAFDDPFLTNATLHELP
ncbi:MAG TPA: DUF711 family protein [Terriglobales bacterium]|nr:DUF711 family protein [Terriglobales bacterium]